MNKSEIKTKVKTYGGNKNIKNRWGFNKSGKSPDKLLKLKTEIKEKEFYKF